MKDHFECKMCIALHSKTAREIVRMLFGKHSVHLCKLHLKEVLVLDVQTTFARKKS